MALNKKNTDYNSGDLILLRPITKDEEKRDIPAVFQVKKKNEQGEFVVDKDTVSSVYGDIFKLETYSYEWEGTVTWGYKVFLRDDKVNEAYILDCRFNMLTRSLANNLLNLTDVKNVTLGVYKNKKGFNSAFVKNGEASVGWKYSVAELPVATEILHPKLKDEKTGKPKLLSRDFSEVDSWFVDKINEFSVVHGLNGKRKTEQPVVVKNDEELDLAEVSQNDDGDIPW